MTDHTKDPPRMFPWAWPRNRLAPEPGRTSSSVGWSASFASSFGAAGIVGLTMGALERWQLLSDPTILFAAAAISIGMWLLSRIHFGRLREKANALLEMVDFSKGLESHEWAIKTLNRIRNVTAVFCWFNVSTSTVLLYNIARGFSPSGTIVFTVVLIIGLNVSTADLHLRFRVHDGIERLKSTLENMIEFLRHRPRANP